MATQPTTPKKTKQPRKSPATTSARSRRSSRKAVAAIDGSDVGYFTGAWRELRLVHWPDRRATWSLTIAVILFSLLFAGIILALDFGFNELLRTVLL